MVQFASLKLQVGILFKAVIRVALIFVRMGKWSLPICGPRVISTVRTRCDDMMVRSIVEYFRFFGLYLVPKFEGWLA